ILAYTKEIQKSIDIQNSGAHAITTKDIRWLRCDIKSLNLLGNVLAKQKAINNNCNEAILFREDNITEGSSTNVFVVKNNIIYTHPVTNLILNGITRKYVIQLSHKMDIPLKESSF